MNPRTILLLLVALLGVIAVFLMTRSFLSTQSSQNTAQVAQKPEITILVAVRDLKVGKMLAAEDFEFRTWPESGINDAFFRNQNDAREINGQVVRYPISQGEPLTRTSLVSPGERGFLAAALAPGMRAVTVQVTPTSGVGGFIFAGDRVDVILTHEPEGRPMVAETVLQNVRVLGTDQRSGKDEQSPRIAKTVTLEVTPRMAEKVAILPRMGMLSLALRSLALNEGAPDADPNSPPIDAALTHTYSAEVSKLLKKPSAEELNEGKVTVTRGGNVNVLKFQNPLPVAENDNAENAAKKEGGQ